MNSWLYSLVLVISFCCPRHLMAVDPTPSGPPKASFPGFSWERVPLNIHFGKRRADMTDREIDFIASHSRLVVLEKSHGAKIHGNTEAGIADTARRLKDCNSNVNVLFYLNGFINWPGYACFETYDADWTLRNENDQVVTHPSGTPRPDPSNAAFREWWSDDIKVSY